MDRRRFLLTSLAGVVAAPLAVYYCGRIRSSNKPSMAKQYVDAYVEAGVLVGYLWRNYGHLFSDDEHRAVRAMMGEAKISHYCKAGRAPAEYADLIREMMGSIEAPETKALLADGVDEFYRRGCERVLRDHSASIIINRCPRCACIVVSPKSRQCLWCHHDWHDLA